MYQSFEKIEASIFTNLLKEAVEKINNLKIYCDAFLTRTADTIK